MNWIILAFVIIIAGVWVFSSRYQKEYYAQGEQMGGPYLIQFKDVDILPELLSNRKLRETIDTLSMLTATAKTTVCTLKLMIKNCSS